MSPHAVCIAFSSRIALILVSVAPWVVTAGPALNLVYSTNDRAALLCIKSHLFKPNNLTGGLATWSNGSQNFCRWHGVSCSRRHANAPRVVLALDLEGEGLVGQIPPCISNLTDVARIHLPFNQLVGPMPPELGRLGKLKYINLSSNSLSGVIPAELASCSGLRIISLRNNSLDGGIPAAFFNCSLMQVIDLLMNGLYGPIPSSLGNLSSLVSLYAAGNHLTGDIPDSLARLSNLQILDFSYNNLSGTVPSAIYNLSALTYLGLGNNGFVGRLPSTMGNTLPKIEEIIMSVNKLNGEIPRSLANATNLIHIFLAQNSFSGVIPSLGTLLNLQKVILFENRQLEAGDWTFLSSLTNCTQLSFLVLDGNNIQGNFPSSVSNLSIHLEYLVLGSNHITGTIPSGIVNLISLSILYLDNNMLTGPIPESIGKLRNMFALNLSKNKFDGNIPPSLGNLDRLSELYLQENGFSGAMPAELAGCEKLVALNLSSNTLGGPIPQGLLGKLNQLSWFLDLSNNQFSHSIPDDIGSLMNLESLNISYNKISGKIPSNLGSCVLLQELRLEGNLLEGEIPPSLGALKGIKEIDFSQNDLSGKIPEIFAMFNSLQYLNLSFNNLDGPLPTNGIFANTTGRLFFQGNPRLCTTTPMQNIPLCSAKLSARKNMSLAKLLAIILLPLVSVSLLFLFLFLKKGTRKDSRFLLESSTEFRILSYNDLSKATDKFSSENLIGSGQFSLVYKGSLYDQEQGQMIAVKVFKLSQSSASKSFFAECRALRNIRHRNLVKVITACSTYDPLGNEFKALVLEYMPNGSLAERLHTKSAIYGYLSLGARISIAVDVASVLEYLHIWSVPPMVHCDLKPSNILFGDDNLPRVGDFGLARFLHDFSASGWYQNSTSMIGPKGSVGYIPPEYGLVSIMSTEGDIYSYGIVLLEMLTGKHPTDELFDDGFTLHKYVEKALPEIGEILDPDLSEEIGGDHSHGCIESYKQHNKTEVQKCILQLLNLGLQCSEEAPKDRPNIQDVYSEVVAVKEHFLSCSAKET
ncbi:unnamed protein product [Urochloa decumbens]|uniref:Receptor kinase-like protein Xa21 n=1 Tax=Urochloa decumbens TaxID=240449 RepID=A0ABC8VK45_9POAL